MTFPQYLYSHLLSIAMAASSVLFAIHILGTRRSPQSLLAWILAVAFLPFVAIPLYLAFGARKIPARNRGKGQPYAAGAAGAEGTAPRGTIEQVLHAEGLPPAREGNRFELLPDGERAYAALIDLIAGAQRSIHLTIFILGDDRTGWGVIDALAARARAGVEVRVIVDAVGSVKIAGRAARKLAEAGGALRTFMPLLHAPLRGRSNLRSHRKLVVVDGERVFTGGMNIAEEYMGPAPLAGRWRDVAALAAGPVAIDAERLFAADWAFCGGARADLAQPTAPRVEPGASARLQLVPSGPDVPCDAFYDAVVSAIFAATERVAVVTPYFVPEDTVLLALCLAARRGVQTLLVLPARSNHALTDFARRGPLRDLLEAGVDVALYPHGMVHAKAMVADRTFAFVGSPNLDMRSLYLNYENALFVHSPDHVAQVAAWIDALRAQCALEHAPPPASLWLVEQVARLVAPEL